MVLFSPVLKYLAFRPPTRELVTSNLHRLRNTQTRRKKKKISVATDKWRRRLDLKYCVCALEHVVLILHDV